MTMEAVQHEVPKAPCPFCDKLLDAATSVTTDQKPKPEHDVTICMYCGEWLVFTETGFRKPRDDEYETIAADKNCTKVRKAWLRLKERGENTLRPEEEGMYYSVSDLKDGWDPSNPESSKPYLRSAIKEHEMSHEDMERLLDSVTDLVDEWTSIDKHPPANAPDHGSKGYYYCMSHASRASLLSFVMGASAPLQTLAALPQDLRKPMVDVLVEAFSAGMNSAMKKVGELMAEQDRSHKERMEKKRKERMEKNDG